jgi:hypothetical protein
MLAHGALIPTTNVSPLFGSFLVYSYNASPSESPVGNQIRFDNASFPAVTKVWIANTTVDGVDQSSPSATSPTAARSWCRTRLARRLDPLRHPRAGDKGAYVEIPVAFQQATGALTARQVIVAVFNPGPTMTFAAVAAAEAEIAPETLPLSLAGRDEEEFLVDEDEEAEDAAADVDEAVRASKRRRPRA